MKTAQQNRRYDLILTLLTCVFVSGCNDDELRVQYGHSTSSLGTKSINGAAAFRKMFELEGCRTVTTRRLSQRAYTHDAMVWFPATVRVPGSEALDWLETWLADEPRTLVYVCRGYAAGAREYWRTARASAAPEQRLEYRRREARTASEQASLLSGTQKQVLSNGWFTLETKPNYSETKRLKGAWTEELSEPDRTFQTRFTIREYDPVTDALPQAGTGLPGTQTTGTAAQPNPHIKFTPLLESDENETLVARLESTHWPESQVIVCSSAEFLLNLQLIDEGNRELSMLLVESCDSPTEVGFYRTVYGARVSGAAKDEAAAGMELLTTWPLSITTMHAVVLGLITCLALLPIFGRPAKRRPPSSSNFGDHVSAVAQLLQRAGDEQYMRQRIAEYATQVRGDESEALMNLSPPQIQPQPASEPDRDDDKVKGTTP